MIRKIIIDKPKEKKKNVLKPLSKDPVDCINMLFLNQKYDGSDSVEREIKKKVSGYRAQDVKKKRLDKTFISYEETLEKLVISKLKCHYCKSTVLIMYNNKREKTQWTLDRLDNSLCHSSANTVICCLNCNLQKRCRTENKFKFTKQMRIIKEK